MSLANILILYIFFEQRYYIFLIDEGKLFY